MVSSSGNTPAKLPFEMITDTLASLQQDVQATVDTITEGMNDLHTQGAEVLHALQMLQAPPAKPIRPLQPRWVAGSVGLVVGVVLSTAVLLWWRQPPATANFTSAFFTLDAVLVDAWKSLPKDLQGKLELAYRAGQVRPPSERSK